MINTYYMNTLHDQSQSINMHVHFIGRACRNIGGVIINNFTCNRLVTKVFIGKLLAIYYGMSVIDPPICLS